MTRENILEKVTPLAVGLFEARGIESLAWNIAARGDMLAARAAKRMQLEMKPRSSRLKFGI